MNEIFWIFVELTRMAKLKDFNGTLGGSGVETPGKNCISRGKNKFYPNFSWISWVNRN